MLRKITLLFVLLCVAGMTYEWLLRDSRMFGERKTLRIGAEGWQILEFRLYDQIREFQNRHPEINIELHQLPAGYDTNLMLQASMKDLAYDVILSGNNYSIDRYYTRGLVCQINPLAAAGFDKDIIPAMLKAARINVAEEANLYLLPYMGEVEVLNYRKDLLAEAGLTRPPETWQEFEEYAEKLQVCFRAKGPDCKLYPMSLNLEQGGFFLQNVYLVLLRSFRGSAVDENGHTDMSSKEAGEVFRTVKRWWKKGLIDPACKTPGQAADDFKSGLTAMFPTWQSRGQWAMRQNKEMAPKIALAPLPGSKSPLPGSPDKKVGSLIAVYGGMVLKESRVQAEAVQFLTEAMCGYAQEALMQAGKMPVTHAAYRSEKVQDWQVQIGTTIADGYTAPEPIMFFDLAEYLSVAFHKYLNSPDDDPAPFLREAAYNAKTRVYDRQRPAK